MKRKIANEILIEYGVNAADAARLVAKACEGLTGEKTGGLERAELMVLQRRVVTKGGNEGRRNGEF